MTLARYVTRLFLTDLALLLFGFVSLVQSFDLMKHAEGILRRHGGDASVLIFYVALRLPEILSELLPLCVLLAALATLARMAYHNEVLAMRSAGMPLARLMLSFAPVALAIAGCHFILNDWLSPGATRALTHWDAKSAPLSMTVARLDDGGVWLRDGATVVHVERVLKHGTELSGVTLFVLDKQANLAERISAASATWHHGKWMLKRVGALRVADANHRTIDRMRWRTALKPDGFEEAATPPELMGARQLLYFSLHPEKGNYPPNMYRIWLYKRVVTLFVSPLMILLAAPVASGLGRLGGIALGFGAAVALGLLFIVCDGLLLSFGHSGAIPPLLAAWGAICLFAAIASAYLLHTQGWRVADLPAKMRAIHS